MNVECLALPLANRLAQEYQQQNASALQFFAHNPYDIQSYQDRLEYLRGRSYSHRELLAEGLYTFNQKIGNHQEALQRIEALKRPDTYVVIGGQQAGVLTGPLYTIHKAVHLIQTAKKLSNELQAEVVPVFWIAGADHDIEEKLSSLHVPTSAIFRLIIQTNHRLRPQKLRSRPPRRLQASCRRIRMRPLTCMI